MSDPQQAPFPPPGQPSARPQTAPPAPPYGQRQQSAPPSLAAAPQGAPPATPPYAGQEPAASGHFPVYPTYAPGSPAASSVSLGRVAFIIALIAFGLGLLSSIVIPILYSSLGYGFGYGLLNGIGNILIVAGSIAALVIGLVAIRRPGPRVLAGIAIGIAAAGIAGTVVSWISTLLYTFI